MGETSFATAASKLNHSPAHSTRGKTLSIKTALCTRVAGILAEYCE